MSGHRQRPARHRAMLTSVAALLAACGTSSPTPPKLQNQSGGPPPVRVATNSAANQMVPLGNGLMTYLECAPRGSEAQVQFAVLAGSVFVSSGLAELAATVLV